MCPLFGGKVKILPDGLEIISVDLEYGDAGGLAREEFDVHIRLLKTGDEPEPVGWGYELTRYVRSRWGPDEFRLTTSVLPRPESMEDRD